MFSTFPLTSLFKFNFAHPKLANMPIPARWHKPSCDSPQVVVDDGIPRCRACGSDASDLLRRAAEEPAASYGGIRLPQEAPIGQMNLWWPPCVPYTRNGAPVSQSVTSTEDSATLPTQTSESSLSEIYTSTLEKGHFRLLYLSGSPRLDSPIHGTLVDYRHDNCPEYETVSYTWGGEEGDGRAYRPSYLGDFWDLLLLTRNCWSLLQYLRPKMGTRVVWVDAICINQYNLQERSAQVHLMLQIYGNCMRVVIYPGDHLVRRDEHKARDRIWFNATTTDKERRSLCEPVLDSRYMRRIWIIQELILAQSAILAIGNNDIYLQNDNLDQSGDFSSADGARSSSLREGRRWLKSMGRPWEMRETTLYEGLTMTHASQATDPRDTIFGILGILGVNRAYPDIVPEYSISMRDCVIGIMGHVLLTLKEIWPLSNASNANTKPQYPSWVPNLTSRESWREFPIPRLGYIEQTELVCEKWATVMSLEWYWSRYIYPISGYYNEIESHEHLLIGSWIPWHHGASIDSHSGALTLRLVRPFATPHTIVEESNGSLRDDIDCHFCVKGPSALAYFASTKKPPGLDKPYHMFLAFGDGDIGLLMEQDIPPGPLPTWCRTADMCLVLADEAEAPGTFRLVSCCRLADAIFLSASPLRPQPSHLFRQEPNGAQDVLSLYGNLYNIIHYDARRHTQIPSNEAMLFDMIVPGRGGDAPDFLKLALAAARTGESATVTEDFRRAYAAVLQCSPTEFNPILDDEYVWFTLADDDVLGRFWDSLSRFSKDLKPPEPHQDFRIACWSKIFPPWFDLQIPGIGVSVYEWECSKTDKKCGQHQDYRLGDSKLHYWLPCAAEPAELQMPVRAKMPLKEIVEAMLGTRLGWLLTQLLAFSEKVSEDAETLLARGPRPEDSNIYLSEWPQSLVDELGFVWRSEMVTFV